MKPIKPMPAVFLVLFIWALTLIGVSMCERRATVKRLAPREVQFKADITNATPTNEVIYDFPPLQQQ